MIFYSRREEQKKDLKKAGIESYISVLFNMACVEDLYSYEVKMRWDT